MSIELYQRVAVTIDIPAEYLQRGDVATVVEKLSPSLETHNEPGYALEIFNAVGETTAVVFVPVSAVRSLTAGEMLHIRPSDTALAK